MRTKQTTKNDTALAVAYWIIQVLFYGGIAGLVVSYLMK